MKVLVTFFLGVATLAFITASSSSSSSKSSSSSEDLTAGEISFNNFKLQYGKKYKPKDERRAFENFLINLAEIETHNAQPGITYTLGVNEYADLSVTEFELFFTGLIPSPTARSLPQSSPPAANFTFGPIIFEPLPASLDLTEFLQPPQNQGLCASSYAYAPVAALEAQFKMNLGTEIKFSEQQIIDCSGNGTGCRGGSINQFSDYVRNNGIMTKSAYDALRGNKCLKALGKSALGNFTFKGFKPISNNANFIKRALKDHGVLVATINITPLRFFKSGIYTGSQTDLPPNYAVNLIGYDFDTASNLEYQKVRISLEITPFVEPAKKFVTLIPLLVAGGIALTKTAAASAAIDFLAPHVSEIPPK